MSKLRNPENRDADYELVQSFRNGNPDSFEQLVERHQKRLFNISYRMVGSYEDAGEIVQDVFLSAYRNIGKFEGRSLFSTWLCTIAINLSKSRLRRMKSEACRKAFSLNDPVTGEDGVLNIELASDQPSAIDLLQKKEIQEKVQECVNTLEVDFRSVVVLRDIQGFAYEEIGAILKLPEGTVKSRLFRARDMMRNCLKRIMGSI